MLRERDLAFLSTRAIDPQVATERGYATANGNLSALGFSEKQCQLGSGLLIPVWTTDGSVAFPQFRPDTPRVQEDGEPGPKYETPAGARLVIDAHPRIRPELGNPKRRLIVCESAPKADACISHGEVAIAVVGVWGWRGTNRRGGKTALPDWEAIALNDRAVYLAFDSDVWTNRHVRLAVERLGAYLQRKARVRICRIPQADDGSKQGIDDYIAAGGDLAQLLSAAVSFDRFVAESRGTLSVDDFRAYMPMHKYIFMPTGELWPSSSVNARIKRVGVESPSEWLDRNHAVEQMTWAPGEPTLIEDRVIANGGWIQHPGTTVFNLYRPPQLTAGNPGGAQPWIDHVHWLYPNEADHIIHWLAQRVQYPGVKINHALVLGGDQGIGKDTLLEPVKHAVGAWNVNEVSPVQLLGRFNGFVKSVILRVSEARDLGDIDRYSFYEHMKVLTAAPPDVLRVDEKNTNEYAVPNVCGVVITSNHKTNGIYLPADDRRHFVAWSERTASSAPADYWNKAYRYYADGGIADVAAYLATLDLSQFDPKAPPPKTAAFWEIVDAGRAPEDAELTDALEGLGYPDAVTLDQIASKAADVNPDFAAWLRERKNRRQIPFRLESAGYVTARNPATSDGRWKANGRNQVIYARRDFSDRDRIAAAQRLVGR
jgi:hypothetical protein